jgi:hypothetical protein
MNQFVKKLYQTDP